MNNFSTLISDVDGSILTQMGEITVENILSEIHPRNALPEVVEKLNDWKSKGNKIILVSARPNILRRFTERELRRLNIPFDQLILDCGNGERVLINNYRENSLVPTARAINLPMNEGYKNIIL